MFPDGWARVADLEYRLHLSRATCGGEAARRDELQAAVTAARHAIELYRNVFDYRSMVIMQFDTAVVLQRLGEQQAALTALQAALDMDRDYGFQDDAAENYKLLRTWRGQPADPAQIATFMQNFPKRHVTFKFGWRPGHAQVALESRRERLEEGHVLQSRATAVLERHVGADPGGGWSVSYASPLSQYVPGVWPRVQGSKESDLYFPPALLPEPDYKVSPSGVFEGAVDSTAFVSGLDVRTESLIRSRAPSGSKARKLTQQAIATMTAFLSPGLLEAAAEQNYDLQTGMWIGATLDQGVWYEISAPLSLAGMPRVVVQHQIEFSFARTVRCAAGAAAPACVELVIRATPDRQALEHAMADIRLQVPGFTDYSSSIEIRIVTDPATLLPYAREERIYWYASIGKGGGDSAVESEHLESTTNER
ncbi:MAG TPA: hypothetical protein VHY19_02740 [Steroidobacteraceae bacterium]|nr:hypothetical protein [Steroidobacteraceae bacterium]